MVSILLLRLLSACLVACADVGELADGKEDQGDHQAENVLRRTRLGRQR